MTSRRDGATLGADIVAVDDLLDSWKEIATYLNRDVRTARRWEAARGLPVHRLPGGSRRAVYARKSELDAWRLTPPRCADRLAQSAPALSIAYARVRQAAERALTLDESLAPARIALATARLFGDWNWELARAQFSRANVQTVEPSGPIGIGFYYILDGRPDAARRYLREALARDPLSAVLRTQAATSCIGLRDLDTATSLLQEALELDEQLPTATFWLGFCRGVQQRADDAIRLLQAAAARGLIVSLPYLACMLASAGRNEDASAVHERLAQAPAGGYVSPLHLAVSHAALGHQARCLELLADAEAERAPVFTLSLVGKGFLDLCPAWLQQWFDAKASTLGLPVVAR